MDFYVYCREEEKIKCCREKLAQIWQDDESWLIFCGFFCWVLGLGWGFFPFFFLGQPKETQQHGEHIAHLTHRSNIFSLKIVVISLFLHTLAVR